MKQNWLGFVDGGNSGHGLGRGFANDLNAALVFLLPDFGSEILTESTHLEKLGLIRPGVGRDTISDFTTNLIKHFLCDYTQRFTQKHIAEDLSRDFVVGRVAFNRKTETWMSGTYRLPNLDGDFVLLTPKDILTRDDTWINHTDMVHSFDHLLTAVDDAQIRAQMEIYLARRLSQEPTRKELNEARARIIREFPILVDLYINAKEDDREEASSISAERTADAHSVLVSQVQVAAVGLVHSKVAREPISTLPGFPRGMAGGAYDWQGPRRSGLHSTSWGSVAGVDLEAAGLQSGGQASREACASVPGRHSP